ncbi:DUF4940 domain-containing protein [Pseudothermotoga sp. U03pept]|uniref:DUF4940 domain-containing protein n=1 Tax=Pseudothermotoga sp. U03pept TaxID=3447012 RepID=UPI003F045E9F
MRIYAATSDRVIVDSLELKEDLSKYVELVLQSKVPIALKVGDEILSLSCVDTILGPTVVGFIREEFFAEPIIEYLNGIILQSDLLPNFMVQLSKSIGEWRGKISLGLLSTDRQEVRFEYREKLSKVTIKILSLDDKDLYVFATEEISVGKNVKLAMSSKCSKTLQAIREAFVVDRYGDFTGLCSYRDLYNVELSVELDDDDAGLISSRLSSQSVKEFAERMKLPLHDAYKVQRSLEEKYWLLFDIGIDSYLYAVGLRNWQGKVSK